ncbi:MAG: FAD-dependent oxidoreductase [Ignavibacteriaceae bacterium]|nr:FAD-dependent oxidoreductase [Ignavibacteriaceae bacterium]
MLVVGGGTGGTAAGIQSARSGAKSIIVEETSWLGGMITSAGVSATDGNHTLPSGIWQEFRNELYKYYGGAEEVHTGWVSYTLFEPHVADSIFKAIAAKESNLKIIYNYRFLNVLKQGNKVTGAEFINNENNKIKINAKIVIDATELGDVLKDAGATYDVGMESKAYTGEACALDSAYGIIQDITYAAILKDFGKGADKTIPRPAAYDSTLFTCSCKTDKCPNAGSNPQQMLDYGRLPNNKYMINWPEHGNDYYVNAIEMDYAQRAKAYAAAKEKTLCFVYYIQNSLGYKNLGLADDEFPTIDKLPFIPYNREGRRVKGLVRFTVNDLLNPYSQQKKVYRTSVSVGDYPIDQHIVESFKVPDRKFPGVPSFGIPLGCLIPANTSGLIVAEKGISASNIVNGATRLQPCVLLTGQAAGVLASLCASENIEPKDIDIRELQKKLLDCNAYIMPFIDMKPDDPDFKAIQRIGATGILEGAGVPCGWENQTWFYPEREISQYELVQGLKKFYTTYDNYDEATGETLTISSLLKILSLSGNKVALSQVKQDWDKFGFSKSFDENLNLNRRMTAVIIDYYLQPFNNPVDIYGNVKFNKASE